MMEEDVKDQFDLCKIALRRAMGHLARMETLLEDDEKRCGCGNELKTEEELSADTCSSCK